MAGAAVAADRVVVSRRMADRPKAIRQFQFGLSRRDE
jgi:hypothetical protein